MHVVDTSVWVNRFVQVDTHHRASRLWLEARVRRGEPIALPSLALAEIAGAVARRTGQTGLGLEAASLVERLHITRLVPVDVGLAKLGAAAAANLQLRGADATYVALAQRLGVPLVTWDEEQRARGKSAVQVFTPEEALRQ